MSPIQLLIRLDLFALMVGLGLGLRLEALAQLRHRPWPVLRVLLGSCVLVPLVALGLLRLPFTLGLEAGARFGIALMAISPSAPMALRKAGRKGGDAHLAALVQVLAAVTAIVSIPLLADLFRWVYGVEGWDIGPAEVARQVLIAQVLPLALGLLLRFRLPLLGERLAGPLTRIASVTQLAVVALILAKVMPKLLPFVRHNGMAIAVCLLMAAAALAIGYLLGEGDRPQRISTALVTSMRNPGLALLFSTTYGKEVNNEELAILTYLLVTLLASIPVLRGLARRPAANAGPG